MLELGQKGADIYLPAHFICSSAGQQAVILREGGPIGAIQGYVAEGVCAWIDFNADGTTAPEVAVEGVGEIKYAEPEQIGLPLQYGPDGN